jgi:signal peptidase I
LLVLFLALFVVRFFFVEGRSMGQTLVPGDFVWVDKLSYGARIPFHPVAIPYSDRFYLSSVEFPYLRMPGLGGVQRQALLAFDDPTGPMDRPKDKRDILMKRCVGLPGDTVRIRGAELRVNGKELEEPAGSIHHYHIRFESDSDIVRILDRYGVGEVIRLSNRGDRVIPLTRRMAERMAEEPSVRFVELWKEEGSHPNAFFPEDPDIDWTSGRVGPVGVPKEGATVSLDTNTLPLYERIIEVYEGHRLVVDDGDIRIDGEVRKQYTFGMDYFYVLGDARPYSEDSRTWGFLPEDHIIGVPLFILFSYDRKGGGIRWERSFKLLE